MLPLPIPACAHLPPASRLPHAARCQCTPSCAPLPHARRRFWEWLVVIGVSVAVNWLANLLQQVTIKELGAPQVRGRPPLAFHGPWLRWPGEAGHGCCFHSGPGPLFVSQHPALSSNQLPPPHMQVAAFLPLRLVGSMIASYFILGEVLDNVLEAVGAGLVLLTLTW